MKSARIHVVTEDPEGYADSRYILRVLQQRWEEQGLQVHVVRAGEAGLEADLAILHVDITRIPNDCLRQLSGYPRVVNGRVTDISKRSFSTQLLQREDAYDGPVIVKTDANSGGLMEHRAELAATNSFFVGSRRAQPPWKRVKYLNPDAYPVFDSIRAVPPGVWANPRLIVEKFLAERAGDLYCLRSWIFLGDREVGSVRRSPHPIVKSFNVVNRERLKGVPDELRQWRAQLGFDYGKFDYAIVDGKVVLYDVNRTPTGRAQMTTESNRRLMDALADGIYEFL